MSLRVFSPSIIEEIIDLLVKNENPYNHKLVIQQVQSNLHTFPALAWLLYNSNNLYLQNRKKCSSIFQAELTLTNNALFKELENIIYNDTIKAQILYNIHLINFINNKTPSAKILSIYFLKLAYKLNPYNIFVMKRLGTCAKNGFLEEMFIKNLLIQVKAMLSECTSKYDTSKKLSINQKKLIDLNEELETALQNSK